MSNLEQDKLDFTFATETQALPVSEDQKNSSQKNQQHEQEEGPQTLEGLTRSLFAEMLGTFILTFVAAGGQVASYLSGGEPSPALLSLASGLIVMAIIFAIGNISGAHINPAVTWAFALRGVFPWSRLLPYWAAQLAGALLAALLIYGMFGLEKDLGATQPKQGPGAGLAAEIVLTCILIIVVLTTATRLKVLGPNSAIPVAATVTACGIIGNPVSGASMNPAFSLGPMLVSGKWEHMWIYIEGPMLGALLAVGIVWILRGDGSVAEKEAAQGKTAETEQTEQSQKNSKPD